MYFAVDLDKKIVVNDKGDEFTISQFKKIIERNTAKGRFFDMTMMVQRLINFSYDINKLIEFYEVIDN